MISKREIYLFLIILYVVLCSPLSYSSELYEFEYQESDEVIANPLKGWVVWGENTTTPPQPSTLFFTYRSWRILEPEEGQFDFDSWEKEIWEHWTSQGMKAIIRVYLDYPGRPTGTPQWLIDSGVSMTRYDEYGGGLSPNYRHPLFLEKVKRLIQKLGERYDNDPRVAFLDVGILGHWGEWHTYPHEELFAPERVQREIVDSFSEAFKNKKMMLRYPNDWTAKEPFGYRDDCFYDDTEGSEDWYFLSRFKSAKAEAIWETQPIGGEFCGGGQGAITKTLADPEKCIRLIKQGHFSHLGPAGGTMQARDDAHQKNIDAMHRSLGYRFVIRNARIPKNPVIGSTNKLYLTIENIGSAPFYYRWPFQIKWLNSDNKSVAVQETDIDIRQWLPGEHNIIIDLLPPKIEQAADLKIALEIFDPSGHGSSIQFANTGEFHDRVFILGVVSISQEMGFHNWRQF